MLQRPDKTTSNDTGFRLSIGLLLICLVIFNLESNAQVKIKLFSGYSPRSAVFTVCAGRYVIETDSGNVFALSAGSSVNLDYSNRSLILKIKDGSVINCPSVVLRGTSGNDAFSVSISRKVPLIRYYSGDLSCSAGNGSVVMINRCQPEDYIAGVVVAEGGTGQYEEYYKTQAILARTFMYKYIEENMSGNNFLSDNTECQVFYGVTHEPAVLKAIAATKGQVIIDSDNALIESAFHSNCGGITSSSNDVWITHKSYLKSVTDTFCLSSKNAKWEKIISLERWINYIKKCGYTGSVADPSVFSFSPMTRTGRYTVGSFGMSFARIRSEMRLPSAFFSVTLKGDSVVLSGRGYGHGVGLCQEGAMKMARKGYNYRYIIGFYYTGVIINDIKKATVRPGLITNL
jgi:stage II sporulation protein D